MTSPCPEQHWVKCRRFLAQEAHRADRYIEHNGLGQVHNDRRQRTHVMSWRRQSSYMLIPAALSPRALRPHDDRHDRRTIKKDRG